MKISRSRSSPTWSSRDSARSGSSALAQVPADLTQLLVVRDPPPDQVDRAVLRGRHQPGARVVRHPVARPLLQARPRVRPAPTPRRCRRRPPDRVRPAMMRADSIRHTASTARRTRADGQISQETRKSDRSVGSWPGSAAVTLPILPYDPGGSGRRGEVLRTEHLQHVGLALPAGHRSRCSFMNRLVHSTASSLDRTS